MTAILMLALVALLLAGCGEDEDRPASPSGPGGLTCTDYTESSGHGGTCDPPA